MCCSMACVAFAWAAWINLIDFVVRRIFRRIFRFSPSRALNDVNQTKAPGYEAGTYRFELLEGSAKQVGDRRGHRFPTTVFYKGGGG
jgi:hypothetical protein